VLNGLRLMWAGAAIFSFAVGFSSTLQLCQPPIHSAPGALAL